MASAITHRGPDDEGFHDSPSAILGMRRLAIIDVAHGAQPVYNEAGDVAVVFNGEIYNYPNLQRRLRQRGHNLDSDGDSACLPHLYEDHGPALFEQLRGMFAVAVWDEREQRLVLGRDRVGKKPLYYHHNGSRLWFASELKALLTVADIPRDIDPIAVDLYLNYHYVPHPHSILRNVHKLPPGHHLIFDRNGVRVTRYWALRYTPSNIKGRTDEVALAEELRDHLLEATRIRMVSERPLGAFLSGGLDSSAVVAAMAHLTDRPVSTFSIGFEEQAFNELPHARRVAQLYGTDHHELVVTPDIAEMVPRIARMFDEPYADSSAIPSFYLAEMARQHVVVALNGDGGDESLGGYGRYARFEQLMRFNFLPAAVARTAGRTLSSIGHRLPEGKLTSTIHHAARAAQFLSTPHPADRYARMMSYLQPGESRDLYRPEFLALVDSHDPYHLMREPWNSNGDADTINTLLGCDVALYLPGDLLPKVDITTMSVGLEARSPLLDHEFMEWAARLPGHLKVRNGTTKYLFKQALTDWLPRDLIHRPKHGFGIPLDLWLKTSLFPMVQDLLLGPDARVASYMNQQKIRAVVDRHSTSGRDGSRLWSLLLLELWHREVLEKPPTTSSF